MPDDHGDVPAAPAPRLRGQRRAIGPNPEVVVIVLTGGTSTRMGRHKPALEVGGRPIIERIVAAAQPRRILVVGSDVAVPAGVTTIADKVPGGGPVSGLATALADLVPGPAAAEQDDRHHHNDHDHDHRDDQPHRHDRKGDLVAEVVVVLAGDLPFVTGTLLDQLVNGLDMGSDSSPADVAVAVDADGRRNWLCAAWQREALRARLAGLGDPTGRSMRQLAEGVVVTEVPHRGEAMDVDTPDDLARARRLSVPVVVLSPDDLGGTCWHP